MEQKKLSTDSAIDLMLLVRTILKRWLVIVVVTVIGATAGFVYSNCFVTPMYKANSTMLVDLRNSVHDDLSTEQVNVAEKYVKTLAYVMKTNTVLQPIIDELKLDETVASLASKITVSAMDETLLIKISIQHPDPKTALSIIKTIGKTAPEIINQKITSGYIIEIESPSVTSAPVSPDVLNYTLMGGAAGLVICLAVIVIIVFFDNKIKSADDLNQLVDLPLLGVIPSAAKNGKGV